MNINTSELDALLTKGRQLQELLENNPAITAYLQAAQGLEKVPELPTDKLVSVSGAAEYLNTSKAVIYRCIADKKIKTYKTPYSNQKKMWLSHLNALVERSV